MCSIGRHLDPLEHLPSRDGPFDLEAARVTIKAAFSTMTPGDGIVDWDAYTNFILEWCDGKQQIPLTALYQLRCSLEHVRGDHRTGELLIAAAKMALAAFMVASPNPHYPLMHRRDEIHDDVRPLVEKAVGLIYRVRDIEPFDPTISVDEDADEDLHQAQDENWLRGLMDRAVKPNGA